MKKKVEICALFPMEDIIIILCGPLPGNSKLAREGYSKTHSNVSEHLCKFTYVRN